MQKILEIFYDDKKAKERLKYYKSKGLKIYESESRAVSSYLDITVIPRGRNIFTKKFNGLKFNTIEFDYNPAREILKAAKMRADTVIIMGFEHY